MASHAQSSIYQSAENFRESTSFGKGKEREKEQELPWAMYMDSTFRPVVEWTFLGPLLVGDDGTIFISCMNGKVYAIEVSLNFHRTERGDCAAFLADVLGTAPDSGPPAYHAPIDGGHEWKDWWQPDVMPNYHDDEKIYGHALLRTNVGNERFEETIFGGLDLEAWNAPSVMLEQMQFVSIEGGLEQKNHVRYRAREVKLNPRATNREEEIPKYCAQMTLPLSNKMKIGSDDLKTNYPVSWGASARYVSFPSVRGIDMITVKETLEWKQAKRTAEHAKENKSKERSECSWEFDAWRDIFSKIRDNPIFSMDKHRVDFVEEKHLCSVPHGDAEINLGGHPILSTCTPDFTFGLATATEDKREGENADDAILTPEDSLNARCLWNLALHRETGLMGDPKILSFGLAFPWAVYEAKKCLAGNVEMQIERASEIYLRMFTDLALVPGKPEEPRPFQSEDSTHFKMFSFTSEGPLWKMVMSYHRRQVERIPLWLPGLGDVPQYNMRLIWQGDITSRAKAWELQTLVNWVHDWAQNEFRPSVCSQLERWHTHVLDLYIAAEPASQGCSPEITISRKQLTDIQKEVEDRKRRVAGKKPDNLNILTNVKTQQSSNWKPPWWTQLLKQGPKRNQVIQKLGLETTSPAKRKVSENSPQRPRKKRKNASCEAAERRAEQEGEIVSNLL